MRFFQTAIALISMSIVHRPLAALLAAAIIALVPPAVAEVVAEQADTAELARPVYHKVENISGNLSSVGSDTLANLVTLWGEQFKRFYPNVNIQVQAAGSSTAPPALTEGTASLGPMSRKMKDNELAAFEARYGYKPTPIPVAIDALAVFVHKDNPLVGLTLAQVDAIFSSTRKCGYPDQINEWGQLGNGGGWKQRDIQLFGRNSVSGTYGYFKDKALCRGDFRNSVNEQPGSASVVQAVSTSVNGIGFSGIGYRTASVRPVPLARDASSPFVEANSENTLSGAYPLARFLYVYVNKPPNASIAKLEREYLRLVLSEQGQGTVVKDGYIPLPAETIRLIREKFDLDMD